MCGRVRNLLREAGPDPKYYVTELTNEIIRTRAENLIIINQLINTYPIDLFRNFDLIIGPDLFMETLLNNFRNEITSYQGFISKFKSNARDQLLTCIRQETDAGNTEKADLLEQKMCRLNEQMIRDRLECSNLFDVLNNEKMTPSFLKLAKIQKNTGTLADVKNDNGDHFLSAELRKKFIWKNYRDTYGSTGPVVTVEDIENFLGPDICNNPITQSKKIPVNLSTDFDLPLSLAELDLAISNANSASAGGTDGINNKVLKKILVPP
jgi:hypothetical protein